MVKALIANALAWIIVLGFPAWAYLDSLKGIIRGVSP